jgi:hypothetical protein
MTRRALLLAGPAALLAAPASAQVSDFRLQPAPTPTPDVIGPPAETPAPRPSPTPTPTLTAPAAAPTPRITLPPTATLTPTPRATASAPTARPSPTTPATATPAATPSTAPSSSAIEAAPAATAPAPAFPGETVATPEKPARSWWPWIVGVFFLGGAIFAGLWWLRRRIGPMGPLVVPEIERPRAPPPAPEPPPAPVVSEPTPQPAAPAAEPHPLHIAIELRKLTLTLMNAALGYRLTLTNAGPEPLEDIAIAADLIGAHASLPREAQLAGLETDLPVSHRLPGLAPGESGDVTGEVRVPLSQLLPIAQGRARLFVPLARFRVGAEGQEPRCFTLVAGQPSPSGNGAVQPVRLDLGPRIYDGLAGRAF